MLIFDLGSNATKASLVIEHKIVRDWRVSTKIGKDVLPDLSLSEDAFVRQCKGIELILNEAAAMYDDSCRNMSMHALGTEALRKAPNSACLVQMLMERFGLELEIISGEREAELEKIAVWNSEARIHQAGNRVLLLDSGGSSTEFNLLEVDGTTIKRGSYPFGQHKVYDAVAAQKKEMPFDEMFHELAELCRIYNPKILIAGGSSMTTYAGYALGLEQYSADKIESQLIGAGAVVPEEKAAMVGKCLTDALTRLLSIPIYVTTLGIRHGWLFLHKYLDGYYSAGALPRTPLKGRALKNPQCLS